MSDALVALRTTDLSLVSDWQVPASEQVFDGDFGTTPTFFKATIGGIVHKMIGLMNKNGIYYAFDRTTINAGPIWQDQLAAPTTNGENNVSSSSWDGTTLYAAAASTTINSLRFNTNSALTLNLGSSTNVLITGGILIGTGTGANNQIISNGKLEGTNTKIQAMKRQAYGFRDHEFYKLKILGIHESKHALVG